MTADHSDAEDRQPGRDMVEAIASYLRGSANPLTAWLLDEAVRRGHDRKHVASALLVTTGFLSQLESGIRPTAEISMDCARACARYLGVPAIVVLLVAGSISIADLTAQEDFGRFRPV